MAAVGSSQSSPALDLSLGGAALVNPVEKWHTNMGGQISVTLESLTFLWSQSTFTKSNHFYWSKKFFRYDIHFWLRISISVTWKFISFDCFKNIWKITMHASILTASYIITCKFLRELIQLACFNPSWHEICNYIMSILKKGPSFGNGMQDRF